MAANRLYFRGTSTIAGSGDVVMGTSASNAVVAHGSVASWLGDPIVDVFTIGAGITIHGNGGIVMQESSYPVTKIVNQGAILGDAAP